jgi:phosphoribosylanthranilate isomerase
VPVAIKFCGLTRAADAEAAVRLGAAYAGVIFAGGPRRLDLRRAREVFAPTEGTMVRRVGVFGTQSRDEIFAMASALDLSVVQLHAERRLDEIARIPRELGRDVWAVARIAGSMVPDSLEALFDLAQGVVLDSRVAGTLGGSGTTFDWAAIGARIAPARNSRQLILAGGLTPENVRDGIRTLRPDVVDVSSGVEARPGEKDHVRMAAFARAVRFNHNDT